MAQCVAIHQALVLTQYIAGLIRLTNHYIAGVDGNDNTTFGKWYSDYKSASSVERVEAFIKLGRPDPAEYADENGPVTWEHVVNEVTKVLKEHETTRS